MHDASLPFLCGSFVLCTHTHTNTENHTILNMILTNMQKQADCRHVNVQMLIKLGQKIEARQVEPVPIGPNVSCLYGEDVCSRFSVGEGWCLLQRWFHDDNIKRRRRTILTRRRWSPTRRRSWLVARMSLGVGVRTITNVAPIHNPSKPKSSDPSKSISIGIAQHKIASYSHTRCFKKYQTFRFLAECANFQTES